MLMWRSDAADAGSAIGTVEKWFLGSKPFNICTKYYCTLKKNRHHFNNYNFAGDTKALKCFVYVLLNMVMLCLNHLLFASKNIQK